MKKQVNMFGCFLWVCVGETGVSQTTTITPKTNVSVSISEVEAVREGHQSEVLLSIAEEFPAELCFTLVFHGRQGTLDLVAESAAEAQAWILGVRKLIHKTQTMDEKERLDQYPLHSNCGFCSVSPQTGGFQDLKLFFLFFY